ncbi:MAG TPA: 16S rRNA (adenine(1518)-N(6)/adenine(1519)-N(6))-dimethyltransferase RsmA [Nitrospirales bacterium]|nr:16S rRNA (adenine(1518)-N(6)/adenine(1519)-N(6))-dimethyltransferase RsmA [Nitrospirales bacterium]
MSPLPPYPRKRLGQHFLIDPNLLRKIINLADLQPDDYVCEIGPGGGALTRLLCQSAKQVLALEVDPRMVDFLKEEFAEFSNLDIQEHDALRFPFDQLPEPAVVVANLPYNISTPIMFRLLEARPKIRRMVLTVQLEVAKRLTAKPNTQDYGVLSVMAQRLADVRFGFPVSRKCFRPVPDVDSGVVRLDIRVHQTFSAQEADAFALVVRAAFGQRRKTLLNALRGAGFSLICLESAQERTGIALTRRAETLSVGEFQNLSEALNNPMLPSAS